MKEWRILGGIDMTLGDFKIILKWWSLGYSPERSELRGNYGIHNTRQWDESWLNPWQEWK